MPTRSNKCEDRVDALPAGRIKKRRLSMLSDFNPSRLSPFDELPDEMIAHILQFLDPTSLKSAVQLDKRFLSVVIQSSKIMKRMPLTVKSYKASKNHELEDMSRQYQEVNFEGIAKNKWFKYMINSFKGFGSNVSRVNFKDCQFPNGVTEILSCFPNVEKLNLVSTDEVTDMKSEPITSMMFPKLVEVQAESVHLQILNSFIDAQLKNLQIFKLESQDWCHLITFLNNQRQIRALKIYEMSQIPEDLQMTTLKDLSVSSLYLFPMVDLKAEKFIAFLMSFAKSVENLSFIGLDNSFNSNPIYEAILSNFKGLKSLTIDDDMLPTNGAFYRNLEVNNKMTALLSCSCLNNPIGLRGLVDTFPCVEKFALAIYAIRNEMHAEDFQYMFENWKNLRGFFLLTPTTDIINRGFFMKITTLYIDTYSHAVNWADVAKKSPKLTTLTIENIPPTNRLDLETVLKSLNHLTVLELGYGFKVTKKELTIIQENPAKLRELRILKASWKAKQEPKDLLKSMKLNIEVKLQETVPVSAAEKVGSSFFLKPLLID